MGREVWDMVNDFGSEEWRCSKGATPPARQLAVYLIVSRIHCGTCLRHRASTASAAPRVRVNPPFSLTEGMKPCQRFVKI